VTALVPIRVAYDALGIDRSTGTRMLDRGEFPIPVTRVGRLNKIHPDELAAFLAGGGGGSALHAAAPTGPTPEARAQLAAALATLSAAEAALAAARAVLEATAA
jgi:hypothetical protein